MTIKIALFWHPEHDGQVIVIRTTNQKSSKYGQLLFIKAYCTYNMSFVSHLHLFIIQHNIKLDSFVNAIEIIWYKLTF